MVACAGLVRKSISRKIRSRLRLLGRRFLSVRAVFLEGARRGKLAELVPDHVFRDEHGIENLAVVDQEGVADEIGRDEGAARPGLDRLLHVGAGHSLDLDHEMVVDEGTFFEGTGHRD